MSEVNEVKEAIKPPTVYEMFLCGSIDADSATEFCKLAGQNYNRDPFVINVNSTGGDVNAGLVINDVLDTFMTNVAFVVGCFSGSMAVTLMQNPEYFRLAYKSSRLLCHGLKVTVVGGMDEVANQCNNVNVVRENIIDRYSRACGLEGDELIEKVFNKDRLYSAQDALELGTRGLIDAIILRDFGAHKYLCRTRGGLKVIDIIKHTPHDIPDLPVWEPPKK